MSQTSNPPATEIHPTFLEQARSLMAGGEVLPGGEKMLARKLQTATETQTPLIVKLGLDPTRPDLHLGHTVVLRKFRQFQDLGHQCILIIGDATAMIGDPSGRNQTRPPLTEEEVTANAQTYLDQAGKIIDIGKAKIMRNSEWLSNMNLSGFLKLAGKATVAQILARDDFSKRYNEQKPIFLHELYYPLMQGYDSVMINADIELGGTDQRFNNLMGRELQLTYAQERESAGEPVKDPQMVLLMPLLEGTDGKIKMSKSYPDHCINITDEPNNMFGKVMSIPDELIHRYEQLLTPISEDQLKEQERLMKVPPEQGGMNPRDVKARLAKWLVGQFHSFEAADAAELAFINQFQKKEIPDDIPEAPVAPNTDHHLPTLMVEYELAPSKSEARRLIQGGGVRLDGEKVSEPDMQINYPTGSSVVLQAGKRKFLKLNF